MTSATAVGSWLSRASEGRGGGPVVQGAVLVITIVYIFATLVADLVVAWLDPRVRETL